MGLGSLLKKGENAADGQDSSDQQAQNQMSGNGRDAKEDTLVDSGKLLSFMNGFFYYANTNNSS
jgi:hypothetical protein